jgi:hypothetical protein
LTVACDVAYPDIVESVHAAIKVVAPYVSVNGLFSATCDALGVRWTRSNHRSVSVAHRRSVALLDAHIGMKA